MILGIDPKVDYTFTHLFGREATRPILIDVLDSVLKPSPGHHIREIELLNPFNPKEALGKKGDMLLFEPVETLPMYDDKPRLEKKHVPFFTIDFQFIRQLLEVITGAERINGLVLLYVRDILVVREQGS